MLKNVAGQNMALFAFDYTTGAPKIDDQANITAYVNKDWAGINAWGNSVVQLNNVTAAGWYHARLATAETNGNALHFTGKSTTANVAIVGQLISTDPPNYPAMLIGGDGVAQANLNQVLGNVVAVDASQRLKVDVEGWIGNNVQSLQSGVPDVNAKNIGNNAVSNSVAMLGVNVVNINGAASVAAAGFVGIDWGKVTNNGAAVVLNATNIGAVTNNVGNVGGNIGGNVAGSVGTVSGNVNGNVVGDVRSVSGNVNGNVLGSVASVTNLNAQLVDAAISSRATTANVNAAATAVIVHGDVAWVTAAGFAVPGSAMTLTAGERTSVADALLNRDMSSGTDSGGGTVRTVRQSLRMLRNKWTANNNVLSVMKEDDVTESWNAALTSDAAAVPITGSDPA